MVCDSRQSSPTSTQLTFEPLDSSRPPAGRFRQLDINDELQQFARARYILVDMQAYHEADTARTDRRRAALPIYPYHAIREISVRCPTLGF